MDGWIKLYRKLLDDAIWKTSSPEHKVVLITLLMMANHEENEWIWEGKKFKIASGQFITSLNSIKKNCGAGISIQNIRGALLNFEKYGFLTNQSTNNGRFITLVKWRVYQGYKFETQQSYQQTGNKALTPNNNDKNDKNDNIYSELIEYLNNRANKRYKINTTSYRKLINARLKDYTVDDIKRVIDFKCSEWIETKFEKYLTPATLFCVKHFDEYLNQAITQKKSSENYIE